MFETQSNIVRDRLLAIEYTNWKGEDHLYFIYPISVKFESTEYYPEKQWLLEASMYGKDDKEFEDPELRKFSLANIKSVKTLSELNA